MEDQKRPLLVAAGIAVVVLVLLATLRVDLSVCSITADTKGERSSRRSAQRGPIARELRLWLDAGDLGDALREALLEEAGARGEGLTLVEKHAEGGHVTVRLDDASLYTPLFAWADVMAVMDFEARSIGDPDTRDKGESRVVLSGACYGVVSPSGFERRLARALAKPLVEQVARTFE